MYSGTDQGRRDWEERATPLNADNGIVMPCPAEDVGHICNPTVFERDVMQGRGDRCCTVDRLAVAATLHRVLLQEVKVGRMVDGCAVCRNDGKKNSRDERDLQASRHRVHFLEKRGSIVGIEDGQICAVRIVLNQNHPESHQDPRLGGSAQMPVAVSKSITAPTTGDSKRMSISIVRIHAQECNMHNRKREKQETPDSNAL